MKKTTASAKLKAIKGSPQKLNLIADLIRNKNAEEALVVLQFCRRRKALEILELLKSAIANAENNFSMDIDNLYIKEVRVGKSFTMRRFRARARGRGARILKPFSSVELIVSERGA